MSIPSNRKHAPAISSPLARGSNNADPSSNVDPSIKSSNPGSNPGSAKRGSRGRASSRNTTKAPQKQPAAPTAKQKLVKESAEKRLQAQNLSFKWQEILFSHQTADKATMIEAAKYIQPAGYEEVIEERNLDDWCGYPMCPNMRKQATSRYRISLSERKVFDQTELSSYCSIDCLQRSNFYAAQLSDVPVWSRDVGGIDVEVIGMDDDVSQAVAQSTYVVKSAKENSAKLRKAYVENLLSTLSPAPTDLKIIEKEISAVPNIGPSDSTPRFDSKVGAYDEIEGYRIQFKGKKSVTGAQDEPTTLILRPLMKENITTPMIENTAVNDEAAIAANAMETMMMLKELKLDEVENSQEQLDLITSDSSKENKEVPSVTPARKPSVTDNASTSQPQKRPSPRSTSSKYDPDQIITVMVPSEVARRVKQTRKKKAKMERNSTVPQMTFFGKIWTLIDRMTTKITRAYLRNLEANGGEIPVIEDPDEQYYSEEYNLRKHIFSEKIMDTFGLVRQQIGLEISIEKDILELIRTLELSDNSMGVLDSVELYMVTLILTKAIIDALPETHSLLSSGKKSVQYQTCCETIGTSKEEVDACVRVLRVSY